MNILIKDIDFPRSGYIDIRLFADGRATTQEGAEMSYRELRVSKASPREGKWKWKIDGKPESGGTTGCATCSKCGAKVWATITNRELNFCPSCGSHNGKNK